MTHESKPIWCQRRLCSVMFACVDTQNSCVGTGCDLCSFIFKCYDPIKRSCWWSHINICSFLPMKASELFFTVCRWKKKTMQRHSSFFCVDATSVKWGNSKGFDWMNRAVTARYCRSKLSIVQWMFVVPTKVLSEQKDNWPTFICINQESTSFIKQNNTSFICAFEYMYTDWRRIYQLTGNKITCS